MEQRKNVLTVTTKQILFHESFDKEQLNGIIPSGITNKLNDRDMENAAKFLLTHSLENECWSAISSTDFLQLHNYCCDGWDSYVEYYLRPSHKQVSHNARATIFALSGGSIDVPQQSDAHHVSDIVKGMNNLIQKAYVFLVEIDGIEYIAPSKKLLADLGIELRRAALVRS